MLITELVTAKAALASLCKLTAAGMVPVTLPIALTGLATLLMMEKSISLTVNKIHTDSPKPNLS